MYIIILLVTFVCVLFAEVNISEKYRKTGYSAETNVWGIFQLGPTTRHQ